MKNRYHLWFGVKTAAEEKCRKSVTSYSTIKLFDCWRTVMHCPMKVVFWHLSTFLERAFVSGRCLSPALARARLAHRPVLGQCAKLFGPLSRCASPSIRRSGADSPLRHSSDGRGDGPRSRRRRHLSPQGAADELRPLPAQPDALHEPRPRQLVH
jgi:hypothetical protein